jgi:hypothetical protein
MVASGSDNGISSDAALSLMLHSLLVVCCNNINSVMILVKLAVYIVNKRHASDWNPRT